MTTNCSEPESSCKFFPTFSKFQDTPETCFIKSVGVYLGQSLTFGFLTIAVLFICDNIPKIFSGNYYFGNIFVISMLFYICLYLITLLLSFTTNLFSHKSQIIVTSNKKTQPPTSTPYKSCPTDDDMIYKPYPNGYFDTEEEFKKFYESQNLEQEMLLIRIREIQRLIDRLMDIPVPTVNEVKSSASVSSQPINLMSSQPVTSKSSEIIPSQCCKSIHHSQEPVKVTMRPGVCPAVPPKMMNVPKHQEYSTLPVQMKESSRVDLKANVRKEYPPYKTCRCDDSKKHTDCTECQRNTNCKCTGKAYTEQYNQQQRQTAHECERAETTYTQQWENVFGEVGCAADSMDPATKGFSQKLI